MEDRLFGFFCGLFGGALLALPAYFYGKLVVIRLWRTSLDAIRESREQGFVDSHLDVAILDDVTGNWNAKSWGRKTETKP